MKRILCFGDSNTFGFDPRDWLGGQYPADVRWTGRLQGMGWEVANCGQNGLSIPRAPEFPDVVELLRRVEADAVTVMLGSNDLLCGASAETAAARMEALLRCMAEHAEPARILLVAPPPMRLGDWVPDRALIGESERLGALYRALALRLGVAFADAADWNVALTYDGVHFSSEGHAAFAAGLARSLSAMFPS